MEKEALFREIISEEKTIRNQRKFKTNDIQEDLLSMAKQMKNNMLAMQATVGTYLSVHLKDTSQSTIGNQMKFMTNEISDNVDKLHQKNKDDFFFTYLFIFSTILFIISLLLHYTYFFSYFH